MLSLLLQSPPGALSALLSRRSRKKNSPSPQTPHDHTAPQDNAAFVCRLVGVFPALVPLFRRCPRYWCIKNAHIGDTHYSAPQPSTACLRFNTREVTHCLLRFLQRSLPGKNANCPLKCKTRWNLKAYSASRSQYPQLSLRQNHNPLNKNG